MCNLGGSRHTVFYGGHTIYFPANFSTFLLTLAFCFWVVTATLMGVEW